MVVRHLQHRPGVERATRSRRTTSRSTGCPGTAGIEQLRDGEAAGPFLQPGEYQLFGRLDTKVSDPVKLVVMP